MLPEWASDGDTWHERLSLQYQLRKAFDESMRSGGDGAVEQAVVQALGSIEEAVEQAVEQALASIEEPGSVQLPHQFVGVRVRQ